MNKFHLLPLLPALAALLICSCQSGSQPEIKNTDTTQTTVRVPVEIEFPSADGLPVTAELYYRESNKDCFIVLCHMAEFNKSEYRKIAPELYKIGYNCLAIDQRSGGSTSGYENETFNAAIQKDLPTGFLDAEQDIESAVAYVDKKYGLPVILWGSSYSASLALKTGKQKKEVFAIIAFSPGEYFRQDSMILKNHIRDIGKPVFITSSRDELNQELMGIIDAIGPATVTHYRPTGKGEHGSMALWEDVPENLEYWKAVKDFLKGLKIPAQ